MMKARNRVSLALAILTSVCLVGAANPAAANGDCEHVTGKFAFTALTITPPTAVGDGNVTGDFPGTFHADYFNIQQGPGGLLKADATHAITTDGGTLVTSDEIILIPQGEAGVHRANSRLHIVGRTGRFAGATGLLHTSGTVNLGTLEGAIGFKGKICFA
jgi:hypothetical protein